VTHISKQERYDQWKLAQGLEVGQQEAGSDPVASSAV